MQSTTTVRPAVTALQTRRRQLAADMTGYSAFEVLQRHSQALDDYFRDSFQMSHVGPQLQISRNPYAIIALGGYGRQEQCLHSDVDILFLFHKNIPTKAEALIREIVFPLWDLGLSVGHATRVVKECLALATQDMDVLTALLDARFICGMSFLYSELMERLAHKVIRPRTTRLVNLLLDESTLRHRVYGDGAYLLEPNLKEGQGGLRDYHAMLWIGRIRYEVRHLRDFEYLGHISHGEHTDLEAALNFVWHVRNHLHQIAGRRCDQLFFEYQTQLAQNLQYAACNGLLPVERFLGDLHRSMETLKQQHILFTSEWAATSVRRANEKTPKAWRNRNFEAVAGRVGFLHPADLATNPDLLLQLFEVCAAQDLPTSAEARRLVREFLHTLDDDFRNDPTVNRRFEELLMAANTCVNIPDEMLVSGFLEQFIPEFRHIMHRIEFNAYHLYPVERHAINTVAALKQIGGSAGQPPNALATAFYAEIEDLPLLFWAALLHDIGKCQPHTDHARAGAVMAETIVQTRGFTPDAVATLGFLVARHRLLYKTATRRDLHDPEAIAACAAIIQDTERLKMLYLLTVADGLATGPKAWSDWTAALVQDLVLKVLHWLQADASVADTARETDFSAKYQIVKASFGPDGKHDLNPAELYAAMPPRYLSSMAPAQITAHLALYERLQTQEFTWQIESSRDAQRRSLTVCARDRPGFFSKLAGVLTLNNIQIFDARVYTWQNQVALDILQVTPPLDPLFETQAWEKVSDQLQAALAGTLNISAALTEKYADMRFRPSVPADKNVEVAVDNQTSLQFSIMEVCANDFPGILFWITDTLFRLELYLAVAKIATQTDQIVDVFYLRTLDGQKLSGTQDVKQVVDAVEKAIRTARGLLNH